MLSPLNELTTFHGVRLFYEVSSTDPNTAASLSERSRLRKNEEIASKIPFAVVGSAQEVETPDGRSVRGRAYPWGVIEVDNEDHCDFVKLRQMLIRTNMEELREHTTNVLYENWRSEKLISMGVVQDPSVFKEVKYVFVLSFVGFCSYLF